MADEGRRFPYTGKIPARKFQPPAEGVKNQFANDGSFLEMFKKQMEKKVNSPEVSAEDGANLDPKKNATKTPPLLSTTSNDKITISSDDLSHHTRTTLTNTDPLATGLSPLVGKRRSDSRRTLKTGIVKKLRINSSDTASNASTNASTKYTEEVKRYKTTMCVEDEKSRPLVK